MHVLIIEDDGLSALLMQHLLRCCGYTSFDVAATEQVAVDAAARRVPDLVTADLCLAEGNGLSAARRIRRFRPVPAVFVTGSPEAVEGCPDAVVLAKPVSFAALQEALAGIFGRGRGGSRSLSL